MSEKNEQQAGIPEPLPGPDAGAYEAPFQAPAPDYSQGYYQSAPAQYDYSQQAYPQPVGYYPAPETDLTGGGKAAWFFIGFLVGIAGILLAYATNIGSLPKVRSSAIKFSAIGFGVTFLIACLAFMGYFALIVALIDSSSRYW